MKKSRLWIVIVLIVSVILVIAAVIFLVYNNAYKNTNNKLIDQEIAEFNEQDYSGIFCSMYPISNYQATDFETYVGVKTYQSSVDAADLKEIARYLEGILQEDSSVSRVFLGLEPSEIWTTLTSEENLQKYLFSYIESNKDVTFHVILPSYSMTHWLAMSNDEVKKTLETYKSLVVQLSAYENVTCYFMGNEEWVINNPNNYSTEYEPNKKVTQKVLLYTFCDGYYTADAENIHEKIMELEELIKKERINPTVYADMSDFQMVFFGDSIIGNYHGSTSILGVMSSFTGCETYNYAIGGSSATDYEGYDQSFKDVAERFINGTAQVAEGDESFVRNAEKELCFVLHYGLNDFFSEYQVDDAEEPYNPETFGGALRSGIQTLQTQYPEAKIVLVLPCCYYKLEECEAEWTDYVKVAAKVAQEMQVYIWDNYSELGIDEDNYKEYLYDGCHPNERGCMKIAIHFIREMEEDFGIAQNITPSQMLSMEMVKNGSLSDGDTITVMLGSSLDGEFSTESEYANFAIADVDDYVNVRNLPSTQGEVVGKIYDGAVAEVLDTAGENNEWFQIISGNVEGYIKAEFFIYGEDAAEVMDEYVTKFVVVKADRLNVRKDATIDSERIGYMDNEEKAKLIEKLDGWMKVQYLNKEGYVSADYVQIAEEYTYAKTLEEERKEIEAQRALEQRENVSENLAPENTEIVQPPNTNYATNTELRASIVNYALQYVGNRYVSGGTSLATGTDCSGFTCFVYAEFGYSISRTPEGQFSGAGRSIDYSQIQPGDIICYSSNGGRSCTHVAMYIGDGQVVHAANSRKGVITSTAEYEPIIGVRNVID